MESVVVDGLVVVRGGRRVLDGLSFAIGSGSVTGVLGPSGSGKTTLLRVLVGVQRITGGSVTVLGSPAGTPALRRRVAYTTQSPSVYDDLTVTENVRHHAALHARPGGAVAPVVEAVGLVDVAGRLVRTLSGGQRARVSLACALVVEPAVLLLDEPTVGLDPALRRDLWALFRSLADAGTTLVVSSHVMDEASRCDRLLLLREGRLLADDSPAGLRGATGTDDLDEAFLRLVDGAAGAAA